MKKSLSFLLLFMISGVMLMAQEKPVTTPYKNEFGFHAGAVTGVGLFYRHWFDKAGLQLTLLPPIKNDEYRLNSAGITFLYSLLDKRYMRVFGYAGAHYWHEEGTEEIFNDYNYTSTNEPFTHDYLNFGFGPGVSFGTKVRVSLMIGYGLYDVTGEFNALPTGEISLAYCF
jgi:hypothetical protein